MINKLKKLYPNYKIYVRKNKLLYDENNNLVKKKLFPLIMIDKNSYEVYKKTYFKKI